MKSTDVTHLGQADVRPVERLVGDGHAHRVLALLPLEEDEVALWSCIRYVLVGLVLGFRGRPNQLTQIKSELVLIASITTTT